jgi:hypothetical protein
MNYSRLINSRQAGFTLIEIILAIVFAAIIGVVFLTYMGTQLTKSGDPVHIARDEGLAEMWMERIISDYVQEINTPATYTTALANIVARDYTTGSYNMPASVTLTRNYVTYDAAGNETILSGGATSNSLKVTIGAGGYSLTSILTAQRTTSGDPITYF